MVAPRSEARHGCGKTVERGFRRSMVNVIADQSASFRTHDAVNFVVMRLALLKSPAMLTAPER